MRDIYIGHFYGEALYANEKVKSAIEYLTDKITQLENENSLLKEQLFLKEYKPKKVSKIVEFLFRDTN